MRRAPKEDVGKAETVASSYPDWADKSRVAYSWDELEFPYRPAAIYMLSSP
jgi:hypothetical protein